MGYIKGVQYLCLVGIPNSRTKPHYKIGVYDGSRFTFDNGPYDRTSLFHINTTHSGSNAYRVLKAKEAKI